MAYHQVTPSVMISSVCLLVAIGWPLLGCFFVRCHLRDYLLLGYPRHDILSIRLPSVWMLSNRLPSLNYSLLGCLVLGSSVRQHSTRLPTCTTRLSFYRLASMMPWLSLTQLYRELTSNRTTLRLHKQRCQLLRLIN